MSKSRNKTTAVPVTSKRKDGRVYRSRAEREAAVNRAVLIITGVIAGLILVILAIAVLIEGVLQPNMAVAAVGNQTISVRQFQNRVKFERWRTGVELGPVANSQFAQQFLTNPQFGPYAEMYQNLQIPTLMGQKVLNDMIDNLVIQQYAQANNITVSDAEIDQQIFDLFGYQPTPMTATPSITPSLTLTPLVTATPTATETPSPEPSVTATPTMTPFPTGQPTPTPNATEQFNTFSENRQAYFEQAAQLSGISEADLREIFREEALREKVRTAVAGEPPKEQEQVRVRRILVSTQQDADDVLKALQNGESFSALAAAVSTDTLSKGNGGLLDWQGQGRRASELDAAIWNAKVGDVIGPINVLTAGSDTGFNIIQVMGREVRPLTNDQGNDIVVERFTEWLNAQRAEKNAQTYATWLDAVPNEPTLRQLGLPEQV